MTDITPGTILVTEDEPAMMRALVDTLTRAGYAVLQATNGTEGLALAQQKHPSCILLDILMPDMDGVAMMEHLRKSEWGKTVPIIILTNLDASDKMIGTILRDQPAYYLMKSNTKLDDLVDKVKNVLSAPSA